VLELAEMVAELCGRPLELRHAAPRAAEIRHSLGKAALARQELGLQPQTSLRDGLAETLAWLAAGRPGLAERAEPLRAVS
jgi:UDP-glucose 4-epimerase